MRRRKLLLAAGTPLVAAVAGCSGSDEPEDNDSEDESNDTETGDNTADGDSNDGTTDGEDGSDDTTDGDDSETGDGSEDEDTTDGEPSMDGPIQEFTATSQNGFIAIGESSDEITARAVGTDLPPVDDADERAVEIDATVLDEESGEWESESVTFPSVTKNVTEIDVEAPDGFKGTISNANDEFTLAGTLRFTVEEGSFEFDIDATSGESGNMSGSALLQRGGGSATVVDNQFVIDDQTGDSVTDAAFQIPSTEPGSNWFELRLNIKAGIAEENPP